MTILQFSLFHVSTFFLVSLLQYNTFPVGETICTTTTGNTEHNYWIRQGGGTVGRMEMSLFRIWNHLKKHVSKPPNSVRIITTLTIGPSDIFASKTNITKRVQAGTGISGECPNMSQYVQTLHPHCVATLQSHCTIVC